MEQLKIQRRDKNSSITLRLPITILNQIEALSILKNTSKNKITLHLITYALENLNDNDKKDINNIIK